MTKPNVVSEAPPGVARNAGVEGVDGRSPASKRRSRARGRKCFATGLASATGEGVRGTCATSPGAIRRLEARCSLPSGYQCLFLHSRKAVPPGSRAGSCCNAKPNIKLTCDWKAEMNLTPAEREQAFRTPHSKVAVLPYGVGNCRSIPVPIRLRVLRWGRARRKPVRRRRGRAGIPGDGSPDSRAGKLRRAER